jgi:hypothetical protein
MSTTSETVFLNSRLSHFLGLKTVISISKEFGQLVVKSVERCWAILVNNTCDLLEVRERNDEADRVRCGLD